MCGVTRCVILFSFNYFLIQLLISWNIGLQPHDLHLLSRHYHAPCEKERLCYLR